MSASSAAVTVLTPNGRRQTVKVSANTPLFQVLEDVCRKHGFDAADHALKFQRTVLDLALQWRFASLPNNASLEMVAAAASARRRQQTPGADGQEVVRVALQMEDGSRLHGSFACGQNLWDVLAHFPQTGVSTAELPLGSLASTGAAATPVCVYMRDEVSGEEALKAATLKSLGLTGGSAVIRFSVRKNNKRSLEEEEEEDDRGNLVETTPTPPMPVAQEPPIKFRHPDRPAETLPDPSVAPTAAAADTWLVKQGDRPSPLDAVRPEAPPTQVEEWPEAPPTRVEEWPEAPPTRVEEWPEAPPTQLEEWPEAPPTRVEDGERAAGLSWGLDSTDQPASSSSSSSSEAQAPSPPTPVVPFSGGGQRLGGGPWPPSSSSSPWPPSSSSSPWPPSSSSSSSSFSSSSLSSQSATCESVGRTEAAAGQTEGLGQPVERRALVYHQDSWVPHDDGGNNLVHRDLPDDFFEVTADDVRQRFAQLKSERRELEEAPLMTKPQREARMRERMERYPRAVVRVQFPDRHVLQGFFGPLETVAALRRFVTDHLEDPRLGFYLFTAPPKTVVDDDASATLYQADLFPGALVYFGADVVRGGYLRSAAVEAQVSALQANESIAAGCTSRCSAPPSALAHGDPTSRAAMETSGPSTQDGVNASSTARNQEPRPSRSHNGKEPKWLKLPGKK